MLDKNLEQSNLLQIIILEAAKNLPQHECIAFHNQLIAKLDKIVEMHPSKTEYKLIHECSNIQDQFPIIAKTLNNLHDMGYKLPFNYIAKEKNF